MNREDIIKLAREAGWSGIFSHIGKDQFMGIWMQEEEFLRFAALVAAAEREACAKVCEQADEDGEGPDCWGWHSKDYAAAIRARGNK